MVSPNQSPLQRLSSWSCLARVIIATALPPPSGRGKPSDGSIVKTRHADYLQSGKPAERRIPTLLGPA